MTKATIFYRSKFESAAIVNSSNVLNIETYKSEILELSYQCYAIADSTAVINTTHYQSPSMFWSVSELLTEMLNISDTLMKKYKPEIVESSYKLLEDGRPCYLYGSRFVEYNQLLNVYKLLKNNKNSKRAAVMIFTPYDTALEVPDRPCTTMYMFKVRDGKLDMTIIFRSKDFFAGWIYDPILSSFVQQSLASWLRVGLGKLIFFENSLHVYKKDYSKLNAVLKTDYPEFDLKDNFNVFFDEISFKCFDDERVDISEYYIELKKVKVCEDLSYCGHIDSALAMLENIKIKMFRDFARVYIIKNSKSFSFCNTEINFETKCFRDWQKLRKGDCNSKVR